MKQHVKMIEGIKYNNVCIKESDLESYKIFPIHNPYNFDEIFVKDDILTGREEVCNDGYFIVARDHCVGVIDINGDVVIPLIWRDMDWLGNGLFMVTTSDGYFQVINTSNQIIDENEYSDILNLSDHYLVCDAYTGTWGLRNAKWKVVIETRHNTQEEVKDLFQRATKKYYFEDSFNKIPSKKDFKVAADSEILRIPFTNHDEAFNNSHYKSSKFLDYLATNVPFGDLKIGFKDECGNIVIEPMFEETTPFSNGYAGVYKFYDKDKKDLNDEEEVLLAHERMDQLETIEDIQDLTQEDLDRAAEALVGVKIGIIDMYGNYITNGIYLQNNMEQTTIRYTHLMYENKLCKLIPTTKVYGIELGSNIIKWFDSCDECLEKIESLTNAKEYNYTPVRTLNF